jgi:nucleotidyltransferase substrate binding protein (TIGR01987 family)
VNAQDAAKTLDLTDYANAVASLEKSITSYSAEKHGEYREILRDSSIQRFEYVFEFSHKILRRYLSWHVPMPQVKVSEISFAELVRIANEHRLFAEPYEIWNKYRRMRNITSHTYNEGAAEQVLEIIPAFLKEVKRFLAKMQENLAAAKDGFAT